VRRCAKQGADLAVRFVRFGPLCRDCNFTIADPHPETLAALLPGGHSLRARWHASWPAALGKGAKAMVFSPSLLRTLGSLVASAALLSGCTPMERAGMPASMPVAAGDWPSYNGTLASSRYSTAATLDARNVASL
jgi:hypothetical protein